MLQSLYVCDEQSGNILDEPRLSALLNVEDENDRDPLRTKFLKQVILLIETESTEGKMNRNVSVFKQKGSSIQLHNPLQNRG